MKRRIFHVFVSILVICLLLAGCTRNENAGGEKTDLGEGDLSFFSEDFQWRDNSLDLYSSVFAVPLKCTETGEELVGGGMQHLLGEEEAIVFKKHLFQDVEQCWDEIKVFQANGTEQSYRLQFREENLNQAWAVGTVFGTGHLIMMDLEWDENKEIRYRFFETDEEMLLLSEFYVEGLNERDYEFPSQMLVDEQGTLHMTVLSETDGLWHYYLLAPGDTVLEEIPIQASAEQVLRLFYLQDGRVGLQRGAELLLSDTEGHTVRKLTELQKVFFRCILWDDHTMLYADMEGLHRCDLAGEAVETIYKWQNHGIRIDSIYDMRITNNQGIELIYAMGQDVCYRKLSPTVEEVPIVEIEFAVSASAYRKYQSAVTAFHKKYPSCHIEMKKYDRNDTELLTKLIAGEGPQLLDTSLVGFENHVDLWEPLDAFYRQTGLDEELIPQVMEMGKLEGGRYGLVPDFTIKTMVTFADSPVDWDYSVFLSTMKASSSKSVFNPINGSDGFTFATLFFHELSENFLYDVKKAETQFDGEEFRDIMRLAKLYMEADKIADLEDFMEGRAYCAVVSIRNPEDLACLRVLGENRLRWIGFPSQGGSVHYLEGADPLCIRVNAETEEKQVAFTFFRYLLSYDRQEVGNGASHWPARKDLLREQFERSEEGTLTELIGFPQISLENAWDPTVDYKTLCDLLQGAKYKNEIPRELKNILVEEIDAYLNGIISEDIMCEHLSNRVGLYLKEY